MPPLQSFSEKHKTRKHKCRAAAPPRRRALYSLIKLARKCDYSLIKLAKHLKVRPEMCIFAVV